ncbi:MAG: helix-turn-helix transcriptional regulator [Firmicutes bacterium]|nr:helix-turn-helix transcriptional regulator [Bacillota bacterium]
MNTEKTGKLISELRREKNLTQGELAELLHVSDKAVSRWETGRGFPDINNLEAISDCLGVTVAELLKGELMEEPVTKEDLATLSNESISLTRALIQKKRFVNTLLGFIIGLAVLTLAVVHLTTPIYISGAEKPLAIEEMPDGRIIGVLEEGVTGYELGDLDIPDGVGHAVFVSCYKTRLDQIRGKQDDNLVLIGNKDDINWIFYYPGVEGDQCLYKNPGAPDLGGGIATLPRLVYNYWIFIGLLATILGAVIYLIFRKKYFARTILKITAIPAALTISIPLCLMGHFTEVYNAGFYLTGILLLAAALYLIFWLILESREKKK